MSSQFEGVVHLGGARMAVGVPLSGISGNLGAACLCMAQETEKEMVILHKLFLPHFMKSGTPFCVREVVPPTFPVSLHI